MTISAGIWALVPAAGSGSRMAATLPKQYLPLSGSPVIVHSIQRLCAVDGVQGVWVGLSANDPYWSEVESQVSDIAKMRGTFVGGKERADTVLNGLKCLASFARPDDWVLVHDAARPCVRPRDIERLIAEVMKTGEGGLLALPVADTVKRVDNQCRIQQTVPREGLWRALTPQLFRLGVLREALERALADGVAITDEASAIEHAGGHPFAIIGQPDNIKITLPGDLALAELFLKQQQEE